ncbi:MAG: polysaccharide biosynthesis tyrosine autokinase [Pirellulales bacterium]|nr:polysaccharide biosynthesis tyrosine autokinase [Pirellulales bacterium]
MTQLPPTLTDDYQPQPRVGLQLILRAARNWWLWCLLAGIPLALAGTIAVWLLFEPVYRAISWLRIEDRQHVAFPGPEDTRRFVQTQKQLIRSPIVLNSVISNPEIARLPDLLEEEDPLEWLSHQLVVDSVGESDIFQIRFDSSTPEGSKKIVDTVLNSYLKTRHSDVDERSFNLIEVLESDLESREKDLGALRDRVRELTKQTAASGGAVTLAPEHKNATETAARSAYLELDRELRQAEIDLLMEEAQHKAIEDQKPTTTFSETMIDQAVEQHPQVQHLLAELQDEEAGLNKRKAVTNDRRVLNILSSKIARLESELKKAREEARPEVVEILQDAARQEHAAQMDELQTRIENHRLLVATLEARINEEKSKLADTGSENLDLEFAREKLNRAEDIHSMISDRVERLRTEMNAPERVTLLSPATLPRKPVEEIPYKQLIAACLAGLLAPFVLAVLWEMRIRRIADPEQIPQETHLPVLGEVTMLPVSAVNGKKKLTHQFNLDRDTFEESIDYLRTNLLLTHAIDTVQVIAIASANSNEGKSNLAAHLAASLARSCHEPVLLIDADLRDPDAHHIFGIGAAPGLVDVLDGRAAAEQAVVSMPPGAPCILPAGRLNKSPHVLLSEGRFHALLEKLRPRYRHIVIDMPPVLPAGDALLLASAADGTLFCTMRDRSRGPQVRLACERLTRAGARLLGAVLSGVPRQTYVNRYGSYHYTYTGGSVAPPDEAVMSNGA